MNKSDLKRNMYKLKGPLAKKGYDWWWHSFTARNRKTGDEKAFFIEYFFINPKLGKGEVIIGENVRKPSYAMIKVGAWGKNAKQIHKFYPIEEVSINSKKLEVIYKDAYLTEHQIKGEINVTKEDERNHPEWFTDPGSMTWDLRVYKKIAYHVGYGASSLFQRLNAFEMFWHAEGIKTEYEGTILYDGEIYDVNRDTSFGYADKNWGKDFTSPWLWLSSSNLYSTKYNKQLLNSALEIGGGQPKIFGMSIPRKVLMVLHYEGKDYDFNFSKFWKRSKVHFNFIQKPQMNHWIVTGYNKEIEISIEIVCPTEEMLFIRYESPDGMMRHHSLWNGGTGYGTILVYDRRKMSILDEITVRNVGCEYGEY